MILGFVSIRITTQSLPDAVPDTTYGAGIVIVALAIVVPVGMLIPVKSHSSERYLHEELVYVSTCNIPNRVPDSIPVAHGLLVLE